MKYLIPYTEYEEVINLMGKGFEHENLEYVKAIVADLTEDQATMLRKEGIEVHENQDAELLYAVPTFAYFQTPPEILNYWNLNSAHAAGFTGTGVKVAILDTGCNDFFAVAMPSNLTRLDFTGLGIGDNNGHGSRGCTMIGQTNSVFTPFGINNFGIAYGAHIYSMRTYENGVLGVILAINYCIANGIDIINISLDVGPSANTAVQAALDAGIIVVCASGNVLTNYMAYPAAYLGVIAVNAVECPTGVLFGSYHYHPGENMVTVTTYNGGCAQAWTGGTSQAAFMLSGLLAIYKQKYPSLNCAKAINLLRRRALKMDGYTYALPSSTYDTLINLETGGGFVNALN